MNLASKALLRRIPLQAYLNIVQTTFVAQLSVKTLVL